jgi:hypothetical protein
MNESGGRIEREELVEAIERVLAMLRARYPGIEERARELAAEAAKE